MRSLESVRRAPSKMLSILLLAAVGGVVGVQPAIGFQQAATLPQAAAPTQGGLIDRVLVRIDGEAILHSQFEAIWLDFRNTLAAQLPQAQLEAQTPLLRLQAMRGVAEGIMQEIRAQDLGITATTNEIDGAIQNMREANGLLDDRAWQQALAESGLTEAILRDQAEASIVTSRLRQSEIQRQIFVHPTEVQSYYENNINEFTTPEQVLFQQLIFLFQGADRTEVRQRAEDALTELRAGVSLTAVGNKYARPAQGDQVHDATTASWITPQDLRPEILATINNLASLETSEIVEAPFGYFIIQLMDRREGTVQPLEEVGGQIDAFLRNRKEGEALERYTSELMKNASIEIYAEEFTDLPSVWVEGSQGVPTGTPGRGR